MEESRDPPTKSQCSTPLQTLKVGATWVFPALDALCRAMPPSLSPTSAQAGWPVHRPEQSPLCPNTLGRSRGVDRQKEEGLCSPTGLCVRLHLHQSSLETPTSGAKSSMGQPTTPSISTPTSDRSHGKVCHTTETNHHPTRHGQADTERAYGFADAPAVRYRMQSSRQGRAAADPMLGGPRGSKVVPEPLRWVFFLSSKFHLPAGSKQKPARSLAGTQASS